MYSTNTITGNSSFGCFVIVLHCVPFSMYQAAKSSENATEICKSGDLAYGTVIKILKAGSYYSHLFTDTFTQQFP
jgi:hypothetical protein